MHEHQAQPFIVPACKQALEFVYSDEDILIINKPSGLLSVPGRLPENNDSVATRVQQQYPQASIVHRLDMDTSGLMVLALNKAAHRHLSRQFEQRQVDKAYTAVVSGHVSSRQGVIDLPLICDWPQRPKQKVDFISGKQAQTLFRCIHYLDEQGDKQPGDRQKATRIELKPYTGRSHQLRVHMQAIGHAILGCKFYANEAEIKQASRLLLHAHYLRFRHPNKNEILNWYRAAEF